MTFSHEGYAKAQSVDTYKSQRRGGRGKTATTKQEDFVKKLLSPILTRRFFVFESRQSFLAQGLPITPGSRTARGKPLVNLLPLSDGEKLQRFYQLRNLIKIIMSLWLPQRV